MPTGRGKPSPPVAEMRAIDARKVGKSYREAGREHTVLDGLNLQVAQGESVAILGRSGCGKSTLLNVLCGIDLPDTGSIQISGQRVDDLDEHRRTLFRRAHVGFVFQFFNLIPTLTALENLLLPLELNGCPDAARAGALLERVGLGHRADSFPDVLSGGEQQRVAIARALVHDPALVLADEPTGNLDAHTGDEIMNTLLETVRERGQTLIMVTHSEAMAHRADRALRLEDGALC